MNTLPVFLAQTDPQDSLAWWRLSNPAFRERLMIFGAITLVTLLLLVWAAFIRRKRRRRHSHHHHQHHPAERRAEGPVASQKEDAGDPPEKRRRRRHSRHRHRPRNPTLAETGGLPPIRTENPPESQP